jgi:nicotinamide-nucleotide amidase
LQAEVLSVGTELLLGEIVDTNAQYISRRLKEWGVDVYRRVTVGDNPARLLATFKEALGRADIVVATGGLGPTADDITAQCLAGALNRPLVFSQAAWEEVVAWFAKRDRVPQNSDRKQAMIIEGGKHLSNANGTAPGQTIFCEDRLAVLLPGPPREMIPMFETQVLPIIAESFPALVPLVCKDLHLAGIGESRVQDILADLIDSSNPTLAPYAGLGQVRLRIAARGKDPEESRNLVLDMERKVRQRLGEHVFGSDGDTLEGVCGRLMTRKSLTLAVAESLTGGLVCQRLTAIPGASKYLKMGIVAYSGIAKGACLGVPLDAVRDQESVNPEVARSMAQGVKALAGAAIGLSTTGFAGPTGGTEKEPIGSVYFGLAYPGGIMVDHQKLAGDRIAVRERAAQHALLMLWRCLKDLL